MGDDSAGTIEPPTATKRLPPIQLKPTPSQTDIMPTPESENFKSMKPKVAPTFNGVDFSDPKAFKAAEDAIIREQWVGAMMIRLVGEEMNKCYMREGVNHLENCGHLRERYLQLLAANKIKGTKFQQQNYMTKQDEAVDLEAKVHPINRIAQLKEDPKGARP